MITNADLLRAKVALKEMAALMVDTSVTLVGGSGNVTVKAHIGLRSTGAVLSSSRQSGLTGAHDQNRMVCVIDADSWDAASPGRPPARGDLLKQGDDRSYAIERVVPAQPGGVKMLYKAELRG